MVKATCQELEGEGTGEGGDDRERILKNNGIYSHSMLLWCTRHPRVHGVAHSVLARTLGAAPITRLIFTNKKTDVQRN